MTENWVKGKTIKETFLSHPGSADESQILPQAAVGLGGAIDQGLKGRREVLSQMAFHTNVIVLHPPSEGGAVCVVEINKGEETSGSQILARTVDGLLPTWIEHRKGIRADDEIKLIARCTQWMIVGLMDQANSPRVTAQVSPSLLQHGCREINAREMRRGMVLAHRS